ncbi:hypothetical protein ACGFYE_00765 [Streptomyces zaomyceticus]|uniref:hypothetical protein n=1 Tax=Streptomyces zaomyceticus TaxID=68286 RepID=UPI0037180EB3
MPRPRIRTRLTMLYGGMFLTAGVLLLAIVHTLGAYALQQRDDTPFALAPGSTVQLTGTTCPGLEPGQSVAPADATVSQCRDGQGGTALDGLRRTSAFALLGLGVIALAVGRTLAGRTLSPVGRITRNARQRAGMRLTGPFPERHPLHDERSGAGVVSRKRTRPRRTTSLS